MKLLNTIANTIKDLKVILAFFGVSGASAMSFITEDVTEFFFINLPIILFVLFIVMSIFVVSSNQALSKRMSIMEINQRKNYLKGRVDSMYKEYGDKPITDEWVIKSLYDLKDELVELEVNSYTQGKLEKMISNIVM